MERIAIGLCRLTAAEFDAMTAREMQWRYDAEVQRENREFERLAQLACWVMNPWISEPKMRVSQMLGSRDRVSEDWWDEE